MTWDGEERRAKRRAADQLGDDELRAIRQIILLLNRLSWLGRMVKGVLVWLVGVAGGLSLISDDAVKLIKHLAGE